jgi:hypothetical protein
MRRGAVFFHPIEGAGSLTISWTAGPKGDAIEAQNGAGVGFFSDAGELLCVIFDEVQTPEDRQTLEFPLHRVELIVRKGKVAYSVHKITSKLVVRKKRAKRRQPSTRRVR